MRKREEAAKRKGAAGTRRAKGAAAWLAAAFCALGAMAREYANKAETVARDAWGPFVMNVEAGIRVVRPGSVEITYSSLWDGQPGGTGTVTVTAGGVTLDRAPGAVEGEGVCVWAPEKTGVTILTHTCGTNTLEAKLFLPGAVNACEELATGASDSFRMDVRNGIRPVPFAPVTGITYSDRWNGEPKGLVTVIRPPQDSFYSEKGGEDVCDWAPEAPGFNTLHHTYAGKTLDAHFLVMADVWPGKPYEFQLREPDTVLDSRGEPLCSGPYTWAPAEGGEPPPGLTLNETGVLSGAAACRAGVYAFTAVITPTTGDSFKKTYPLLVMQDGTVFLLR